MSDKLKEIIERWKEYHEKDGKLEPTISDILGKPYDKNEVKIEAILNKHTGQWEIKTKNIEWSIKS